MPLRQAVTRSAAQSEIVIVRFGDATEGQIEVQPEPVAGDKLFAWLHALKSDYGVSVAFADMAQSQEGLINAQVLVLERQP